MNANQKHAIWTGVGAIVADETRYIEFLQNEGQVQVLAVSRPKEPPGVEPELIEDPMDPKATHFSVQGALIRVLNHPDGPFRTELKVADMIECANSVMGDEFAAAAAELFADKYNPLDLPHSIAVKVIQRVLELLKAGGAEESPAFDYLAAPQPPKPVEPPKLAAPAKPGPIRIPTIALSPAAPSSSAPPAGPAPVPPTAAPERSLRLAPRQ